MDKKRVTLTISPDVHLKAKKYVKEITGLPLSTYVNMHLMQFIEVAEGAPVNNKKPSEMTLKEYTEFVQYWTQAADDA